MKQLLAIAAIIMSTLIHAQDVKWATRVIDFSSQLSPGVYSAEQVLGAPDVPEGEGDSPNAWSPEDGNVANYIKVGFDNPERVQQIAIHESFNPGAIDSVFVYDQADREYLIFTNESTLTPRRGRVFNIFFPMTSYPVAAVKVVIDGARVDGINCIDAIGITGSNNRVRISIPDVDLANRNLESLKLGEEVNSDYNEIGPVIGPNCQYLFFSRENHPENIGGVEDDEDIWYSTRDESTGTWTPAVNIGAPLNTEGPNYVASVSAEEDHLVLLLGNQYDKRGRLKAGLSITNNSSGNWSQPEALDIPDLYSLSEVSEYFLSNDQNVLLMSLEREDSRGLNDLYFSIKDENGNWSVPANIGKNINTAHNEFSPVLLDDNRTLYFASAGLAGYGGTDIWVSNRLGDGWDNWSKPENLGPGVNTGGNEFYFTLNAACEFGFVSREINNKIDIYQFNKDELFIEPEPPLTHVMVDLNAFDADSQQPVAAVFDIEKETGRSVYEPVTRTNPQSEYSIELELGHTYKVKAAADGYTSEVLMVDLKGEETGETKSLNLMLKVKPDLPDETIQLGDILFDHNSSYLNLETRKAVQRVIDMVLDGTISKIELIGHTDNTGSEAYNMWISERRVKRISKIFERYGMDINNIQMKWYGESLPKYPNDSEENRAKNRRVEMRVIE